MVSCLRQSQNCHPDSGVNRYTWFHLGDGEGGIEHILGQFRPAFESWWATMTTPALTDETCRRIIDGVKAEARGKTLSDLAAERDAILLPLLELVAKRD